MTKAEELLNSLSESVPMHSHPVPDTDTYFVIDPITRQIENTNRKKAVVMQYDHNSERFTFELPRYVDGHDMLQCTSVTVNCDNIETETGTTNSDAPDMTDLSINPTNPDTVISSWLISRNLTQLAGILSFSIEYKCVDTDGNVVYEWSTDIFDDVTVKVRKKNGEAAVLEYTDLLEQWRTRIFGAGDSVMSDIAAEGEAQITAVKEESTTQREAVELKGMETLESIPEDYTEVGNMAEEAVRSKADAIACSAEGEAIFVNDASDDHVRGLRIFGKTTQASTTGKNLLCVTAKTQTLNGVTFTVNDDKSVTVMGTATENTNCLIASDVPSQYGAKTIRFSGGVAGSESTYFFQTNTYKGEVGTSYFDYDGKGTLVNLDNSEITKIDTYIRVKSGVTVNKVFYPMACDSSITDITYEPYTGGVPAPNPDYPQELMSVEDVTIGVFGKNLLKYASESITTNGVSFTVTTDGGVKCIGTATAAALFEMVVTYDFPEQYVPGLTYIISGAKDRVAIQVYEQRDGWQQLLSTPDSGIFTISETATGLLIRLIVKEGISVDTTIYPMVSVVSSGDPIYQKYVKEQTVTVSRSLPGIPVPTGGNYTDENGQQWICDEIDLERGVYVQRLLSKLLDDFNTATLDSSGNGFTEGHINVGTKLATRGLCDSFPYKGAGNELRFAGAGNCAYFTIPGDLTLDEWKARMTEISPKVLLVLAAPIETPLTAEEIAAFKALKTNYPNTTILNDAGAWMSVKYNADTKSYVENPKILRLTDSSTGVVYELKIVDGALSVIPV